METTDGGAVAPPPEHRFVWIEATVTNPQDRPLDWSAAAIATLGERGECVEVRWLPTRSGRQLPVVDSATPWGPYVDGRIPPREVGTGHLLFACEHAGERTSRSLRVFYGYAESWGAVEVWHEASHSMPTTHKEARSP